MAAALRLEAPLRRRLYAYARAHTRARVGAHARMPAQTTRACVDAPRVVLVCEARMNGERLLGQNHRPVLQRGQK